MGEAGAVGEEEADAGEHGLVGRSEVGAVEWRHGGLVGGTCAKEPEGSGNVLEVDGEVFANGERVGVVNVVGGE